jgi:DNA repair photolyase
MAARMIVREVFAKSVLSKSRIQDYTVNAYVGCSHSCRYCYAAFMKRFTGHREKWGEFVDAKVNAPEVLEKQIRGKTPGRVWVSGVCDPYQAAEETYRLTRSCLEILKNHRWPVTIQTKSPLVLRDLDVLRQFADLEVGFSIATADEKIRVLFEPGAPPVSERIRALDLLHATGIKTFAMIAPILPGVEGLIDRLPGKVDNILVDRLNYAHANRVYAANKLDWARQDRFFRDKAEELSRGFRARQIPVHVLF